MQVFPATWNLMGAEGVKAIEMVLVALGLDGSMKLAWVVICTVSAKAAAENRVETDASRMVFMDMIPMLTFEKTADDHPGCP